MQVRAFEIDDLFAAFVLDPGVADVPLTRDGPIEDRRARGDFVDVEVDMRC